MPDVPFEELFSGPGFWVAVGADFLLVVSLFFTVIYAAVLLVSSFLPAYFSLKPNALGIPALFALAMLFTFSPAGMYVIDEAEAALHLLAYSIDFAFQSSLILLWLAGACVAVLLLAGRQAALLRILSRLQKAGPDPALEQAKTVLGHTKPVRLLEVDDKGLVASWGLFRPAIIVPSGFMEAYEERERHCIYLHELVHLRGRDSWKNLFAALVRALFWFNPGVRHAVNRFGSHLEISCDHKVMRASGVSPEEYAGLISRSLRSRHGLLTGFSGDCHDVVRRLRYIFQDRTMLSLTRERLWSTACVAVLALFFICTLGSREQLQTLIPDPDEGTRALLEELMRREAEEARVFEWGGMLGKYSMSIWTTNDRPVGE